MPVPESSYSRRYGRGEESTYTSSYSRSSSGTGLGRSYLSSYTSKSSSSLPPRPPAYDIRKYTDTSVGSRFLSSSASRARDYGSSTTNYRASVSPTRASSSIRRQLESSAPSIAERIKAMEIGETDDSSNAISSSSAPTTRLSRYSTLRSRDSALGGSKSSYTSVYARDRSGSKDYGTSSSMLPSSSSLSRGDSTKSSTENLRSRASPSGSSAPLSRSGSGGGMRNGTSKEVNPTSSNDSATNVTTNSASNKSVTVATTTITTKPTASDENNKCAKDIENNDSDSLGSNSSSLSVTSYSDNKKVNNGLSSNNMNGNNSSENNTTTTENNKRLLHNNSQVTTTTLSSSDNNIKMAKDSRKPLRSAIGISAGTTPDILPTSFLSSSTSATTVGVVGDKDSNGNPISMDIVKPSSSSKDNQTDTLMNQSSGITSKKSSSSYGSSVSVGVNPIGAKDSSRLVKKWESDSNANNILQQDNLPSTTSGIVTCNGDSAHREKSPYEEATLNYSPKSSMINKISPIGSRKLSSPKVIFHTIKVEEPINNKEISPEPVSYTVTARPSLDGTEPKIEIKRNVSENVTAEFKVTLPKLKSTSTTPSVSSVPSSKGESVHNNKINSNNDEDVERVTEKSTTMSGNNSSINKNKETSPITIVKRITVRNVEKSPTPEKEKKVETTSFKNSSRDSTPTPITTTTITTAPRVVPKSKSPSPVSVNKVGVEINGTLASTNGEVENPNINALDSNSMGPHTSKYATTSTRDSPNRNETRERERPGRYSHLTTATTTTTSDSSDNDSDAFSSSPQLGGRFRTKDGLEKAGLTGLRNIGNTCFMNTVLQCLSNTKPLLEYVIKDNYESDINRTTSGMKGALMRAFGELIHELWREQRVVDTSAFKDSIQRFAPRFMGYSQQDAQEFLRYLLEGMHEDVNRVTAKPTPILTDIDDSLGDNEIAAESWKRYLRYESSKIVDMFVGQFKSTLKCTVCGHCSVTFDPFWDLSLPIPSRSSNTKLAQCFELFAKEEVLDGDEKPTCAKCQCRRKCTKSLAIQKFPKILVVHLKRFSLAERYRGKLSTLVDYPLQGLDLTPFAATRGQGCLYNLYGVANHSGSTYSGHYIAYCKHPYTGEWHCYNDSRVSPISPHSVVSSEGYVLFYEQAGQSSLL